VIGGKYLVSPHYSSKRIFKIIKRNIMSEELETPVEETPVVETEVPTEASESI
jgi:hypothetical protein